MGMSTGGSGSYKNDINVTPLIDVVLVLLIISMVTLPKKLHNEEATMPPEADNKENYITRKQVEVEVVESGSFLVTYGKQENKVRRTELASKFGEKIINNKVVFFDCADLVTWNDCITAFDVVQEIDANVKIQWRATKPEASAPSAPSS